MTREVVNLGLLWINVIALVCQFVAYGRWVLAALSLFGGLALVGYLRGKFMGSVP